jgi:hypothetical protein
MLKLPPQMATITPVTSYTSALCRRTSIEDADYHHLITNSIPLRVSSDTRVVRRESFNSTSDCIGGPNAYDAPRQSFTNSGETAGRGRRRKGASKNAWHHGIGGAGNQTSRLNASAVSIILSDASSETLYMPPAARSGADRLKARLGAYIAARNARPSLFEAWQRKQAASATERVFEDSHSSSSSPSLGKPDPSPFGMEDVCGSFAWWI